jgi:hypothetical protein
VLHGLRSTGWLPLEPISRRRWDAFARHLNLFPPETESPAERRRRNGPEVITDHGLRARSSFADGLAALIDLGTADRDGADVTADDIDRRVADGGVVAVVGPSGYGKSFLGQRVAVRHCDNGRLVVWIRAGEYEQGCFKDLLARAMAAFSWSFQKNCGRGLPLPTQRSTTAVRPPISSTRACTRRLRLPSASAKCGTSCLASVVSPTVRRTPAGGGRF